MPVPFQRGTSEDVPRCRVRPLDIEADLEHAVEWYRDPEVLHCSEGDADPYDERQVRRMYAHLGDGGDVFVIEVEHEGEWIAVGDAVLRPGTLPIVIGDPRFRGRGIGSIVLADLIQRARRRGWAELNVHKVFADNERSLRLYRSAGFEEVDRVSDEEGREVIRLRLNVSLH